VPARASLAVRRAALLSRVTRRLVPPYNGVRHHQPAPMKPEELQALPRTGVFPAGTITERIIAEKQGPVGWITFNNPERRNAVSIDMWEAIPKAADAFERDAEIRVIVLKGAGDKAFVSGADVSQYEKQRASAEDVRRYDEIAGRAVERLQAC